MEYLREFPQMFRYAVRGDGPKIAIGGGFALGFLVGIGKAVPLAALPASLVALPVLGYLFGYMIEVTQVSSRGQDYPADLPNYKDPMRAFLRPLGAFLFLVLLGYLPMFAAIGIRATVGPMGGLVTLIVAVAFLVGFVALPILYLRYAVSGSFRETLNLPEILTSALKILPWYAFTILFFLILDLFVVFVWVLLQFGTALFLDPDSAFSYGIASIGSSIVYLFLFVAQSFLIGRLYQHFKETLRWTL